MDKVTMSSGVGAKSKSARFDRKYSTRSAIPQCIPQPFMSRENPEDLAKNAVNLAHSRIL